MAALTDAENMDRLIAERRALWEAWDALYSPDDYPGFRRWRAAQSAAGALNDFDHDHPEVGEELNRRANERRNHGGE